MFVCFNIIQRAEARAKIGLMIKQKYFNFSNPINNFTVKDF